MVIIIAINSVNITIIINYDNYDNYENCKVLLLLLTTINANWDKQVKRKLKIYYRYSTSTRLKI